MAAKTVRFQVDSRLARLLSQEYPSTEKALKELVDNAWDADAENVHISLPAPMSDAPIVISDDGTGMTPAELESHYLAIARDRRDHRGERTAGKQRLVKGRKGIGKFAGLMAAAEMTLETRTRGTLSRFTLRMKDLAGVEDIEHLPIQIDTERCDAELHGTTITLHSLHGELAFPDAARMRQILIFEYQASKREEWRALLKQRDIVQPEADVHTVAADPYQLVGNDPSPTLESYGEHYRQWDGINQLIADLRQVPAQLPELRAATRRRFYGLRLKMLLEGMEEQAENLAVQETQTSISRDTIGLREQQLAALLQAARATLDGVIEEELLAAIKAQPPKDVVHDFLAPRMETAIRQWWNEQNAVLNKQMSELNNPVPALSAGPAPKEPRGPKEASRQAGGGRNHGVRVDSIFKKMKDLLQDHQEGQIGMSLSKAKEELGKFDGVSSLEEYLKLAGKSGKFKTEEAAEAARDALRLQGWISFVPVVVELGGLIMDVVDNEQRKVELRKRREELRDQVRKQATAIAQTAWEKWQRPAHEFQQLLQQERDQLAQQHMRLNLQLTELQRGSARLRQIL